MQKRETATVEKYENRRPKIQKSSKNAAVGHKGPKVIKNPTKSSANADKPVRCDIR